MSEHTCCKEVADHTGFYFHPCGKPAKYAVQFQSKISYFCGRHIRHWQKLKQSLPNHINQFTITELPK